MCTEHKYPSADAKMTLALLSAMVLGGWGWAAGEASNPPPQGVRLELTLEDGSRVIGVPGIETVPIRTEYARMEVPLARIMTVRIADDHENASLDLVNGDKLKGVVTLKPLELATLFGSVKVGVEQIREIGVVLSASGLPASLARGLVLYYAFDRDEGDRVTDKSGKGCHASVKGATWVAEGMKGGAYQFGETDQAITVAGPIDLGPSYTLALWAKFKHFENPYPLLIGSPIGIGEQSGELGMICKGPAYDPAERQQLSFCAGYDLKIRTHRVDGGRLVAGSWALCVVVVDRDKAFLYVDGKQVTSVTGQRVKNMSLSKLNFGFPVRSGPLASEFGPSQQFNGLMDEVMIWSRALSREEVAMLAGGDGR